MTPQQMGRYPLRPGNRITPLIDGIACFSRLEACFRGAQRSLWIAVSFVHKDFRFPSGALLWEVLSDCAARGVDVRLLFWRNFSFPLAANAIFGTPAERAWLAQVAPGVRARWEASPEPAHCHHQKLWVIDAGAPRERAILGGMIMGNTTVDDPRHLRPRSRHDVCVEVEGPVVADLAANFVERWAAGVDPIPSAEEAGPLTVTAPASPRGAVLARAGRTVRAGLYGGQGEADILAEYREALAGARRCVYLENQHPGEESLLSLLADALRRGVEVLYVVPGEPMRPIYDERRRWEAWQAAGALGEPPRYASTFARLLALASFENFTLAAPFVPAPEGGWRAVYVHAKLCLVDGHWGTCGSANLVDLSLAPDHTELNLSWWDEETTSALLAPLAREHAEVTATDAADCVQQMARVARENAARRASGVDLVGHLVALRPSEYAR